MENTFIVHINKQQHQPKLPYEKAFNEKMVEKLVKVWKKEKPVSNFSTLSIDDMYTKKKYKSTLLVSIATTKQNLHNRSKALQPY